MNRRIGMKVVFVLELAREKRKEVAAETGAAKSSYSSVEGVLSKQTGSSYVAARRHTNVCPDVVNWVRFPKLLLGWREA